MLVFIADLERWPARFGLLRHGPYLLTGRTGARRA
jgi:hypothetical protein